MPKKISIKTVSDDLTYITEKVDVVAENTNLILDRLDKIPTKEDLEEMLERSMSFATLKAEHDRMKQIILEHFNIEI